MLEAVVAIVLMVRPLGRVAGIVLDSAMSLGDVAAERGDVAARIGVRTERSHAAVSEERAG